MIVKASIEVVPLTLELAMEFATMPSMPGERELLSGRMTWMRKLVADSQFFGVEWHKGTERDSGKLFRLDGQHSSRMLAEIDAVNFPASLQATITSWEFDHNDRAQIFDYYNNPKSVRNSRDVMGVYRAEHEDLLNISRDMLVKAANGLKSYYMSVENGVIYTTRKRGLYWTEPQHRDFARWINSFDGTLNHWLLGCEGVVAEMYTDYLAAPLLANEFWSYVTRENHPESDHETRELARLFNEWKNRAAKPQAEYRKKAALYWKRFSRIRIFEADKVSAREIEPEAPQPAA